MKDLRNLFPQLPGTLDEKDWGMGLRVCKGSCVTVGESLSVLSFPSPPPLMGASWVQIPLERG